MHLAHCSKPHHCGIKHPVVLKIDRISAELDHACLAQALLLTKLKLRTKDCTLAHTSARDASVCLYILFQYSLLYIITTENTTKFYFQYNCQLFFSYIYHLEWVSAKCPVSIVFTCPLMCNSYLFTVAKYTDFHVSLCKLDII